MKDMFHLILTEGNIRVSGNIEIENNGINKGYYPTENHTLILDGTEKQIVKINESYDNSSHINNLIIENIDTYSVDDIEAKLSVICVRNRVSFDLDEESDEKPTSVFSLEDSGIEDDLTPSWIKAALATKREME